jgi:hypothetical protein
VLSFLVGMQDTNSVLRETLKNYMNEPELAERFKFVWLRERKEYFKSISLDFDQSSLDVVSHKTVYIRTKVSKYKKYYQQ